jgi:putative membrane protein
MPHHHGTTGSWEVSVLLTVVFVFMALTYLRGWLHLHSTNGRIPVWRATSFLAGLLLIWIAVGSPIVALDHQLLTIHMVQHLLLMTLAPPLLWLGEPVLAFTSDLARPIVSALELHSPVAEHLRNVLTQPTFCLFAASAALVGWHIPAVFALGMNSGAWHVVQQATFLATGLLFWWPVVQPWPSVSRPELSTILYLFFATLPCDILSGFLVFCDRVVYVDYLSSSHLFGFSALGDQQCAGALMWTWVTIVYLIAGVVLTMHLLLPQSARANKLARSDWRTRTTPPLIRPSVEAL